MLSFVSLSVLSLAVSSVAGLVVPRLAHAPSWPDSLEKYEPYHTRYLAIGCQNKHSDVDFFDKCCRPLPYGTQPDPACGSSSATPNSDSDDDSDDDCDETDGPDSEGNDDHTDYDAPPNPAHGPEAKTSNVGVTAGVTASANGIVKGGFATFYYQNGNAGACGQKHGDYDMIGAMDSRRYGDTSKKSWMCGRRVRITNPKNHKSVEITIADACPTCDNSNSIDLSVGAFKAIASLEQGEVAMEWQLL